MWKLHIESQKKWFLHTNAFINTVKKLCLSYKFINKTCHLILSDYEWKSFLSRTNKHEFSSELFRNLLICQQPPKQLWDSRWFSSLTSQRPDQTNCVAYKKCVFSCLIIHFDVCLNAFTRHSGTHVAYDAPNFYKKRKQPQPQQQQQQQKQHKYLEELIVDLF